MHYVGLTLGKEKAVFWYFGVLDKICPARRSEIASFLPILLTIIRLHIYWTLLLMMNVSIVSHGEMSSLSAASASSRPFFPTKEDIHRKRVELLHLKHTVIPDRRNRKRGRHVKHETSRLIWIDTVGLPNLLRGKLPSAEDEKALNLPHPNATDEDGKQLLTESNRRWMDGKSLPTSTISTLH